MRHINQLNYMEGTNAERLALSGRLPENGTLFWETDTDSYWLLEGWWYPLGGDRYRISEIFDEFYFTHNQLSSYDFGDLNWKLLTSSGTPVASNLPATTSHVGVQGIQTGALINNNAIGSPSWATTALPVRVEHIDIIECIIRSPTITTEVIRFGLGTDLANATFGTDGVFFQYSSAVGALWYANTRAGGVQTTTSTTINNVANNWFWLMIVNQLAATTPAWLFFVNGTLRATLTTNIPSNNAMTFGFYVEALAGAAARQLQLDYFHLRTLTLGQRYT